MFLFCPAGVPRQPLPSGSPHIQGGLGGQASTQLASTRHNLDISSSCHIHKRKLSEMEGLLLLAFQTNKVGILFHK